DRNGDPVPCDVGRFKVDVSISFDGPDGEFTPVKGDSLHVECTEGGRSDLAFVMDNSGSLGDFVPDLKSAADNAMGGVVKDGGRASFVRVSTDANVGLELTDDREALSGQIDGMYVDGGWTALYDGIRMGNETLGGAIAPVDVAAYRNESTFCSASRKIGILAFTDGRENNSAHQNLRNDDYPGDGLDTNFEDLKNLRVDGITTPIYTVGLGSEPDHESLEELASYTGGRHMAIREPKDLNRVFGLVADYVQSTHQLCGTIEADRCGAATVRVKHSYKNGKLSAKGFQEININVPCEVTTPSRVVTILMTMSNPGIDRAVAAQLASQSLDWASPVEMPRVLVVRDDNHHNEYKNDPVFVRDVLVEDLGYEAVLMEEPATGLTPKMLEGFDAVWFSNPGYPIDDEGSKSALLAFSAEGGGVVVQGDDMGQSWGLGFSMVPLTHLDFVDNGTSYCGKNIDNNGGGRYVVEIAGGDHPVTAGLGGVTFEYGDDIDTTLPRGEGEEVLAWATVKGASNCNPKPVIVAFTP
ncbi:MAG: VWA domain-containing protein, partial [Myxococcales bacterium]|nr:VWA domain-containing protein [Myxococcales bacterium]